MESLYFSLNGHHSAKQYKLLQEKLFKRLLTEKSEAWIKRKLLAQDDEEIMHASEADLELLIDEDGKGQLIRAFMRSLPNTDADKLAYLQLCGILIDTEAQDADHQAQDQEEKPMQMQLRKKQRVKYY